MSQAQLQEASFLIAAVCHRLQLPIFTHNVKHLARILDPALVIQPY
ncbi:MAG: hypothetical protein KDE31_13875 [Caldilineaceae bacterium]|nr:hypothetical protein [Caldilineaceae bacterium]